MTTSDRDRSATPSTQDGRKRRGRRLPPWWVWLLVAAPVGLVLWLRSGDRTGDAGMTNVYTGMLLIVTAIIAVIWFAFARAYAPRTRLLALAGLAAVLVAFFTVFRIDHVTGSMVPVLAPRFGAAKAPGLTDGATGAPGTATGTATGAVTRGATGGAIDLASTTAFDFPGFLGPRRDQQVRGVTLDRDWDSHPPQLLWRQPIGAGWSAFAVVNGTAVTQEERDGRQMVTAYDAETGALVWAHDWSGPFDHSLGGPGPRSTPTIDGGFVYAMGPHGRLVCLDGADGSLAWDVDLLSMFGISPSQELATLPYGRSGSPLVHGDLVIVPAGGTGGADLANLVAFEKLSGDRVWTGGPHQISHSSPSAATLGGVEQILIVNEDTVTGHDIATGRLLWEHPWHGRSNMDATASQAVALPPASVLVSKGYGIGAALLDLEPSAGDGTFTAQRRWHHRRSLRTKFTNVVIRDGHAYGLSDGIFECVELDGGARVWKDGRYGHGQILGVGDLLLLLTEDGEIVLIEPSPETPNRVLGRVPGIDGLTWNNIALYRDLLLVRNGQEAAGYRLALVDG